MKLLKELYDDLNHNKKTIVRTQWCQAFELSERNFWKHLNSPDLEDVVFFHQILDIPLDTLLLHYKRPEISPSLLLSDVEKSAATLRLARN